MTKEIQSNRPCIFCREPANSREHLLPDWLKKVLPAKEKVIHSRQVNGGTEQRWTRKPFEEKTKQVCSACNEGWMSTLENLSKPILTPMITRNQIPLALSSQDQWITATWAAKTVYVLASQLTNSFIPPMHPFLVRENWMPPSQVNVWIGSHDRARRDPLNSVFIVKPLWASAVDDLADRQAEFGYMAFAAIGGISFLMIGHRHTGRLRFRLNPPASELLFKLWPREAETLNWPPPLIMDREMIDLVLDQEVRPPQLEMMLAGDAYPPRPRLRQRGK